MEIKIDNNSMTQLVIRTIAESLSADQVQEYITTGLGQILTNDYEVRKYFQDLVKQNVKEHLENNPHLRQRLKAITASAIDKMLADAESQEALADKIANVITDSLLGRRRGY